MEITGKIQEKIKDIPLPQGVTLTYGGDQEQNNEQNPQQQIEKRLFMPGMPKIWKIQQPAVLCLVTLNNHILDILKDSVLRYDALIK